MGKIPEDLRIPAEWQRTIFGAVASAAVVILIAAVTALISGYTSINYRMNTFEAQFGERIARIEGMQAGMIQRLDRIESKLDRALP